jgi:hypothetical protein
LFSAANSKGTKKEVQMQKKTSLLFGITLILLGVLALAGNLLVRAVGGSISLGLRAWPIFVVGIGLLFCMAPFIFTRLPGLSGLFIPGLPILFTGIILFITSVTNNWHLWTYLWPLEVIGLALGFVMMSIFLKNPWLMIPASIVGFTGLALLFCALTGEWRAWAVLWTVEPLAVGLPLLLIGLIKKLDGVKTAGIILCGIAGLAFAGLSALLVTSVWITRIIGPAIVLILGLLLVGAAIWNRKPAAQE